MLTGSVVKWDESGEQPPVRLRLLGGLVIALSVMAIVFLPKYFAIGTWIHIFGFILGPLVGFPLFVLWWLFRSRAPWVDRILGVLVWVGCAAVTTVLAHDSMNLVILVYAIPVGMLVTMVALTLLRNVSWRRVRLVIPLVIACASIYWVLLRFEGVDGTVSGVFSWRWEPTAEEKYLDELAAEGAAVEASRPVEPLTLQPRSGDWLQFRGALRDGNVGGTTVSRDWKRQSPKWVWRRAIGPGWSSCAS